MKRQHMTRAPKTAEEIALDDKEVKSTGLAKESKEYETSCRFCFYETVPLDNGRAFSDERGQTLLGESRRCPPKAAWLFCVPYCCRLSKGPPADSCWHPATGIPCGCLVNVGDTYGRIVYRSVIMTSRREGCCAVKKHRGGKCGILKSRMKGSLLTRQDVVTTNMSPPIGKWLSCESRRKINGQGVKVGTMAGWMHR